jgi:hypothetical protein
LRHKVKELLIFSNNYLIDMESQYRFSQQISAPILLAMALHPSQFILSGSSPLLGYLLGDTEKEKQRVPKAVETQEGHLEGYMCQQRPLRDVTNKS